MLIFCIILNEMFLTVATRLIYCDYKMRKRKQWRLPDACLCHFYYYLTKKIFLISIHDEKDFIKWNFLRKFQNTYNFRYWNFTNPSILEKKRSPAYILAFYKSILCSSFIYLFFFCSHIRRLHKLNVL